MLKAQATPPYRITMWQRVSKKVDSIDELFVCQQHFHEWSRSHRFPKQRLTLAT
jgi:hypothetical protein